MYLLQYTKGVNHLLAIVPEIMSESAMYTGTPVAEDYFILEIKGFDIDWCKQPDIGLPKPDLVCYLTLDTEAAAKRGTFGGERYERTDFQKKVMNNFEKLKDSTWKEINADQSIEDLHTEILDLVTKTMAAVEDKPIGKLWIPEDSETK